MSHWITPYMTRQYKEGLYTCASFVAEIVQARLDYDPPIPGEQDFRRWSEVRAEAYFRPFCAPTSIAKASDCDLVLMKVKGRVRDLGSHVGVYINSGIGLVREGLVAHCMRGHNVRVTRIIDLPHTCNLEFVGIYKWLS